MNLRALAPVLLAALCTACGGGGGGGGVAEPAAPDTAAPPAVAHGVRGTVNVGPVVDIGPPYGGTGTLPPGPESEGLSLLAGRAHATEQGRGIVDGTIRVRDGEPSFILTRPAALPDGSLVAIGTVWTSATQIETTLVHVELSGRITTLRGPWQDQVRCDIGSACEFQYSWGMATGPDGRVYVSSTSNGELYIIDADLRSFERFPAFPTFAQHFTVDAQHNLYLQQRDFQLWKRSPDGTTSVVPLNATGHSTPGPFAALPDGRLVYGTFDQVHLYTPGQPTRTVSGFEQVTGLAVDRAGNIYVRDSQTVRRISPSGGLSTVVGQRDPQSIGIEWGPLPARIGPPAGGDVAVVPGGLVIGAAANQYGGGAMFLFARMPIEPVVTP